MLHSCASEHAAALLAGVLAAPGTIGPRRADRSPVAHSAMDEYFGQQKVYLRSDEADNNSCSPCTDAHCYSGHVPRTDAGTAGGSAWYVALPGSRCSRCSP